MSTDLTERGLERLICTAMTGEPCDPPPGPTVGEPPASYGGVDLGPAVCLQDEVRELLLDKLICKRGNFVPC